VPLAHTSPAAQAWPHAPQFCASAPRSLQDAPQRDVPPLHAISDDEVADAPLPDAPLLEAPLLNAPLPEAPLLEAT
jgi:hypothetical protein